MRQLRLAAIAGVAVIAGLVPAARAGTPSVVGRLAIGQAVFWPGTFVATGNVQDDSLCNTAAGPCWDYGLAVATGGHRLRVALDHPVRSDTFSFEVFGPGGAKLTTATTSDAFDAESFVANPQPGTYRIHVLPQGVSSTTFQLRAKLEGEAPAPPVHKVALLPHLRAVPPYEFGFVAPANPLNGLYPPDTANPPLEAAGVHPLSCSYDEMVDDHVSRCLRFTSGPVDEGAGPFEIDFNFVGDNANGRAPVAYQAVHWSDGSVTKRPAGTYDFHVVHGHFHYDGILDYELFRVTDTARGSYVHAGRGNKSGFCPADEQIGEWSKFNQAVAGTYNSGSDANGGNCFSFNNGVLGLSTGWGDIYRWQRPGQYVDFDGQPDGYYLVQATVDHAHLLLGTGSDNVSYAFIHVLGDSVDVVERGLGQSPWDASKQVVPALGGPLR